MDLIGYKQLVNSVIENYGANQKEAMQIVDEALLDYDVITLILNKINENMG